MTAPLAEFSTAISRLVAAASPSVTAIRTGPNRHVTGLLYQDDTVVTTDQALPVQDQYTVVVPGGELLAARPGQRDRLANVAVLRLDARLPAATRAGASAVLGGVVVVVAADPDASATVRLGVIHRFLRTADGPIPVLDLTILDVDQGGPVLDADGRLIGLTAIGPSGQAVVVPHGAIGRTLRPMANGAVPGRLPDALSTVGSGSGRGWLGVALQPIAVPDSLVARTGQMSGRMVVRITAGGPADRGGLRVGDVLLALNDTSVSGPHALRAFLGTDRIGSVVEVKILRDGALLTTQLTVAEQPAGSGA